jgi:hypothetical protein
MCVGESHRLRNRDRALRREEGEQVGVDHVSVGGGQKISVSSLVVMVDMQRS